MVGGLGVRVTLAWREAGNGSAAIRAAGVRVLGSAAPLAPASLLAERLVGMGPVDAESLTAADLLTGLADGRHDALPPSVHRAAHTVIDALRCALGLPRCRPADPQGRGLLVCRCTTVGDREILEAVEEGAVTPEAVAESCGACTGCRSCRPNVLVLIHEKIHSPGPQPGSEVPAVARIVLARAAPHLAAQGVPLRDVEVTGDAVHLRLDAPLPDAVLSPRGAQEIVRRLLRETVAEGIEVTVAAAG